MSLDVKDCSSGRSLGARGQGLSPSTGAGRWMPWQARTKAPPRDQSDLSGQSDRSDLGGMGAWGPRTRTVPLDGGLAPLAMVGHH